MIPRAARKSFVTIHRATSAAASSASRAFTSQSFGRFDDPGLFKHDPLQSEFMQVHRESIAQVQELFKFSRRHIRSDKDAWLQTTRQADELARESPIRRLSGEAALALMLDLLDAGHECNANIHCIDVAVLLVNLHPLGWLNLQPSDKSKLGGFSWAVVQAFQELMPSRAAEFFDLPPADREVMFNRFMGRVAGEAHRADLGLDEQDMQALQQRPIVYIDWPLKEAGFGVNSEHGPMLVMSERLLAHQPDPLLADAAYVHAIGAIAHEVVHAAHNSFLARAPSTLHEFARHRVLRLSNATCDHAIKPLLDPAILPPHEMPAYWVHLETWSMLYDTVGTTVDKDTWRASEALLANPLSSRLRRELHSATRPRPFHPMPKTDV